MSLQDKLKERINSNFKTKENNSLFNRLQAIKIPEGMKPFKPYIDKINQITILPYRVGTDDDPKVKKGEETYILEYFVHRNVGINNDSYLCMKKMYGKPCPICEKIDQLAADYEKNKAIISGLKASKRGLYNIQDTLSNNPEDIILFDSSFALFEKEMLEEVVDPTTNEIVCFPDTSENGYYIKFRATEENFGSIKYNKFKTFRFDKRKKAISAEAIKKVISLDSLLNIPTYEEVKNSFLGIDSDEETTENNGVSKKDEEYYDEVVSPKEQETKKENLCPHGHVYGKDCDAYNECISCIQWEKCSENQQ